MVVFGLAQKPFSATYHKLLMRLGRKALCGTAQKHQFLGRESAAHTEQIAAGRLPVSRALSHTIDRLVVCNWAQIASQTTSGGSIIRVHSIERGT